MPILFTSILYQSEGRVSVMTQVGATTILAWCGEGGRLRLAAVHPLAPGEVMSSEPFDSGQGSDGPPALATLDDQAYLAWKASGSDTIYLARIEVTFPYPDYPAVSGLGEREPVANGAAGPVSLIALPDRLIVGSVGAEGYPTFATVVPADRCPPDPLGPMGAVPEGRDSACELRRIGASEADAITSGIAWEVAGVVPYRENLLLVGPGWYSLYLTLKEGQPDVWSAGDSSEWEAIAGHENLLDEVADPPATPATSWYGIGLSDEDALSAQATALAAINVSGLRDRYNALADTEYASRLGDADFAAAWDALEQLHGFITRAAEAGDRVVHRRRIPAVASEPLPAVGAVSYSVPTANEAARLAPERLGVLRKCMDSHGVAPNALDNDWPFNLLSQRAVAFASGRIAREGDAVVHDYDPTELERCHRIAAEVTARLARLPIRDMDLTEPFESFCLPVNRADPVGEDLDEAAVRAAFRGTLHPWALVRIQPIETCDVRDVEDEVSFHGHRRQQVAQHDEGWTELTSWLADQPDLRGAWYVSVDGAIEGVDAVRLIVARTAAGSLTGSATTGRAYGITHAYTPERIAQELAKAERESDGNWRDGDGRIVARASLRAFEPAELDAWAEATRADVRPMRTRNRGPRWRARFRALVARRELVLTPSWATVQRCLSGGRFSPNVDSETRQPFFAWNSFGEMDATGDRHYRLPAEEVQARADWLTGLDPIWLRQRYHDLRATDYANQRSEADWQATWATFEAVRVFYTEAARAGWDIVVAVTGRSDEDLVREAEQAQPSETPVPKPKKKAGSKVGPVTDCESADKFLRPLLEAMETYGLDEAGNDWPHNGISHRAVRYACGQVAQPDREVTHRHDPAELKRCQRLAKEAAEWLRGYAPDHDQGGPYRAFFVVANIGDEVPREFTEEYVRERLFGGTICPRNRVYLRPIEEMQCDTAVAGPFLRWFKEQPGMHGHASIQIGNADDDESGVVCPLLAVALTDQGSVVGVCGYAIWA